MTETEFEGYAAETTKKYAQVEVIKGGITAIHRERYNKEANLALWQDRAIKAGKRTYKSFTLEEAKRKIMVLEEAITRLPTNQKIIDEIMQKPLAEFQDILLPYYGYTKTEPWI